MTHELLDAVVIEVDDRALVGDLGHRARTVLRLYYAIARFDQSHTFTRI